MEAKEKEQSSIEWLFDKWNDYLLEIGKATFRKYILMAKSLHKKEIIEAFDRGILKGEAPNEYRINGEQYYKENFK